MYAEQQVRPYEAANSIGKDASIGRAAIGLGAPMRDRVGIPLALDQQDQAVSMLAEVISQLDARLRIVSRSEPSEGGRLTSASDAAPVPHIGERISSHNYRLEQLHSRLHSMLDRLEV